MNIRSVTEGHEETAQREEDERARRPAAPSAHRPHAASSPRRRRAGASCCGHPQPPFFAPRLASPDRVRAPRPLRAAVRGRPGAPSTCWSVGGQRAAPPLPLLRRCRCHCRSCSRACACCQRGSGRMGLQEHRLVEVSKRRNPLRALRMTAGVRASLDHLMGSGQLTPLSTRRTGGAWVTRPTPSSAERQRHPGTMRRRRLLLLTRRPS